MVMISSRWPSLLLGVVAVVSSASAYHSSSPGYHSTGCTDVHIGDGYCDNQNNNAECQYDGGDCCECTCVDAGGGDDDYVCGQWTGFACIDPSAPCVDDDDMTAEMVEHCENPTSIGDGWCDRGNNKAICGYDGGDCCKCTCEPPKPEDRGGVSWNYGYFTNLCQDDNFACIDPSAPCVDDDDVTAEVVENCGYIDSIGDGYCQPENNKPECGYDGGDCCSCTCENPDNNWYMCNSFACIDPSAPCADDDDVTVGLVEDCAHPESIGDGRCEVGNNNEECGYDGGDCCSCTCEVDPDGEYQCVTFACVDPSAPCVDDDDVTVDMIGSCWVLGMGDGYCNIQNNNAECAYDGGDCCECTCNESGNCSGYNNFACIDPEAPCVDDDSFTVDMMENCGSPSGFGDGWCQEENNTEECGYDGGDCCECTCTSDDDTYRCQRFACVDPSAPCVDDDDITVDMFENCRDSTTIGNGYCENGNNKAECNWDGGDCCSCDCQTDDPYACGGPYNSFDCKNPASACFGEYVEPQTDDDWHTDDHFYTDDDDAMSYEFIDWSGAIEVGLLTEVGVSANAYDTRAGRSYGDTGCGEDGCVPAYTRDGNASEDESRWACASKLVDGEGPCQIEYTFAEPQDIVGIQVAFWKGNERTRTLEVHLDGVLAHTHESHSGSTFNEIAVAGTGVTTLTLEGIGLTSNEWLSIIEVLIFVTP